MNWGDALAALPALLGLVSSAGPWGVAAMGLAAVSVIFGAGYLIRKNNDRIDSQERERAGADAGQTSSDLRNQSEQNSAWEKDQWEKFQPKDPK